MGRTWPVMLLLSLVGCEGKAPPAPILVGHVAALSGPDKTQGEAAQRGFKLALAEINKDATRPIKVVHADTRGQLKAFEAEAVRLATLNQVVAILGEANVAEAAALGRAHVPILAPLASRSPALSDWVFTTGLSLEMRGRTLARYAVEELAADRALILLDRQNEDDAVLVEAFARSFVAARSKKEPKEAAPRPTIWTLEKDIKPEDLVKRLEAEGPKVVLFAGPPGLFREVRRHAVVPLLFGGESLTISDFASGPPLAAPTYLVTPFVGGPESDKAKEFVKKYQDLFGETPSAAAALAYEDLQFLSEAIKRSRDSLTPARVQEELLKIKAFPGLGGTLQFGSDRQLRRPAFVVGIEAGQAKTSKPYEPE